MRKNRTLLGLLCVVLAAAVAFGTVPLVNSLTSGSLRAVQVVRRISRGQAVTDKDVAAVEIGQKGWDGATLLRMEQVVGKYAAGDLYPKTVLTRDMVTETADSAADVFRTLDGSKLAISVTISGFARGLSGKLQNGDIVRVLLAGQGEEAQSPRELHYVRVVTTTTAGGYDQDQRTPNQDGSYQAPSTVTLLANQTQANLLAQYEAAGKVYLALVYRGDEATAKRFLDAQGAAFAKGGA